MGYLELSSKEKENIIHYSYKVNCKSPVYNYIMSPLAGEFSKILPNRLA